MLLPIGDYQLGAHWSCNTASVDWYTTIDEGVAHTGYPDEIVCLYGDDAGATETIFEMQLPPAGVYVETLKLRSWAITNGGQHTYKLYINGSLVDSTTFPDSSGVELWQEAYWPVGQNSDEITSIRVGIRLSATFSSSAIHSLFLEETVSNPRCNPSYYNPIHLYKMDEVGLTTIAIDSVTDNPQNGIYTNPVVFGATPAANDGGVGVLFEGGYINIPPAAVNSLTNTSISFWCNWSGGPAWQRAFDFSRGPVSNTTGAYYFFTPENGESGLPRFGISLAGRNNDVVIDGLRAFPTNQRVLVVCTWTANVARLYINGELQGSVGTTATLAAVNPSVCYIGYSPWNAYEYFRGVLDNFTIYDRVLTPAEIKKLTDCRPVPLPSDRNLADEMVLFDRLQLNMIWSKGLSDNIDISDIKGSKKAATDTLSFGETLQPTSRLIPQVKDDLGVFEYAQVHNGLISQRVDGLVLKETINVWKTLALSDTLTFNDSADFPFLKLVALKNTLAISESLVFQIPGKFYQYVTDSIYLLEEVTRTSNRYTLKDSLFIIDGILESGVPDRRSLSESLSLSDGTTTNLRIITYKDQLSFTDKARGNLFRLGASDALDLRETLHYSPSRNSLSDTFTLADLATYTTNHPYLREDLTLTDVLKFRLSIINKQLSDTLTIIEKLQYRPNPVRLLDSLVLADQVNRAFPRSFTDTLTLIDTARRYFGNAFVDTLTLNETLLATPSKKLQDALTILDVLCHSLRGRKSLSDTLSLQTYVTYLINDTTVPPTVGDDGWTLNSVYEILLADELLLEDKTPMSGPLCIVGPQVVATAVADNPNLIYFGFTEQLLGGSARFQSNTTLSDWVSFKLRDSTDTYVSPIALSGGQAGDDWIVLEYADVGLEGILAAYDIDAVPPVLMYAFKQPTIRNLKIQAGSGEFEYVV